MSRRTLLLAAICLAAAIPTLLIPAAPGYDAWTWIIWGREVLDGDLQTVGGISWKPLPVLFTAPLSLFGGAAPELWVVVAVAAAFGAVIAAGMLGFKLGGRLGAVLSAGLVLASPWLWEPVLDGGSEGGVLLCVFAAADRHLADRHGQSFAWGLGAALLRPEAWPFLGLYSVWLLARSRDRWRWVVPGLAALPALWLLPELWGSGDLWRGAERAQRDIIMGPSLEENPALAVIERTVQLSSAVVALGLLAGMGAAACRVVPRRALVSAVGLAALGVGWLVLVAVMTERGFSGNDRYLHVPAGMAAVVAGAGLAWALRSLPRLRWSRPAGVAAAVAVAVLATVGMARVLRWEWGPMLDRVDHKGEVVRDLDDAIARAGGERRLEACGSVYASPFVTPAVAWSLGRHLKEVTPVPRPPGVILRTKLLPYLPVDPPPRAFAGAPNRRAVARTKHWHVESACHH